MLPESRAKLLMSNTGQREHLHLTWSLAPAAQRQMMVKFLIAEQTSIQQQKSDRVQCNILLWLAGKSALRQVICASTTEPASANQGFVLVQLLV